MEPGIKEHYIQYLSGVFQFGLDLESEEAWAAAVHALNAAEAYFVCEGVKVRGELVTVTPLTEHQLN